MRQTQCVSVKRCNSMSSVKNISSKAKFDEPNLNYTSFKIVMHLIILTTLPSSKKNGFCI